MSDLQDYREDDDHLETEGQEPNGDTGSVRDTKPVHPLPDNVEAHEDFDKTALRSPEPLDDTKPTEQVEEESSND